MDQTMRPWRSCLYLPASNARALEKAKGLAADAIIFDLEDAVAPDAKAEARDALGTALRAGGFGERARIVRINGAGTPWGADDAAAVAKMPRDVVLIPKVNSGRDVDRVAEAVPDGALWAMIETPAGVLNAADIAAHPRLEGFVMGTNDLAKDLGARYRPDRLALVTALSTALLAARMRGIVCVDGVFNAINDETGFEAECRQGRDLGMDGKTLIHPAQLDVANRVFAPDATEIALAERQIAAFEEAESEGRGVAVVDGEIVENLHVETARATLARAEAIRAREEAAA